LNHAGLDAAGLVFPLVSFGIYVWAIIDFGVLSGDPGSNAFGPLAGNRLPPETRLI
jgi:hypothetical protein